VGGTRTGFRHHQRRYFGCVSIFTISGHHQINPFLTESKTISRARCLALPAVEEAGDRKSKVTSHDVTPPNPVNLSA
jgi:hypothetical protein